MGIKRVDRKVRDLMRRRYYAFDILVIGVLLGPILVIGGMIAGVPGVCLTYIVLLPLFVIFFSIIMMPDEQIELRARRKGWCIESLSLVPDREFNLLLISLSGLFLTLVYLSKAFGGPASDWFWSPARMLFCSLMALPLVLWSVIRHIDKDELYLSRCIGLPLEELEESAQKILKDHDIEFEVLPPYSFDNLVKYRLSNLLEIRYRVGKQIIYIGPLMSYNRKDAYKLAETFDNDLISGLNRKK